MALVVTTPASSRDLTELATVKAELGITATTDDALLATLISQASAIAERWTGWQFAEEILTETLPGTGRLRLVLERTPIVAVSEIRFSGTAVSANDYSIEDRARGFLYKAGRWTEIRPPAPGIVSGPSPESGELLWAVDYTAGYVLPGGSATGTQVELPIDVERGAIEVVAWLYSRRKRDRTVTQERIGDYAVTYKLTSDLPDAAQEALAPWRRLA